MIPQLTGAWVHCEVQTSCASLYMYPHFAPVKMLLHLHFTKPQTLSPGLHYFFGETLQLLLGPGLQCRTVYRFVSRIPKLLALWQFAGSSDLAQTLTSVLMCICETSGSPMLKASISDCIGLALDLDSGHLRPYSVRLVMCLLRFEGSPQTFIPSAETWLLIPSPLFCLLVQYLACCVSLRTLLSLVCV